MMSVYLRAWVPRMKRIFPVILLLMAVLQAAEVESYQPDFSGFGRVVTPFVENHCVGCHGPDQQKGKLRLDDLSADFTNAHAALKWGEVVDSVNGHEMPPEDEEQPDPMAAGEFADWLAAELGRAEIAARSSRVVLRRMNRAEYDNTIRDLIGVDFHPSSVFPEDPPAGGFDNIGQALTISPLLLELYYKAARQVLDRALVNGARPASVKWHFEPEDDVKGSDRTRIDIDGQRPILNKGENVVADGFTAIHHAAWNTGVNIRDFRLPSAGTYIIRFRAAAMVPTHSQVVIATEALLEKNIKRRMKENAEGEKWYREEAAASLAHFRSDRRYDYGPPRVKLTRHLSGTPDIIAEMDIPAKKSAPGVYEVAAYFTTADAGINFEQGYTVPRSLENFMYLDKPSFPRPTLLLDWVEIEGPVLPQWPPASHRAILIDSVNKDNETQYAREILSNFMPKAYRRPVTTQEINAKLALFSKHRASQRSFVEAIKIPLTAVLVSPGFIYLAEPHIPAAAPAPLSGHELASRLSYFLWSSMPDAELMRLANNGEILKPAVLTAQATRMLADPKSEAFVQNFAGQWLGLRKVGANPPVETLYPKYDRHLELSMVRETEGFFAEILRRDLDARLLLKSSFVTINERLARFYGIAGVKGDEIRPVKVGPEVHRGGVVTQASIHSITSNGTRTSPVVRGTWIMKTLLGTDPGLPIANVGEIASQVPGIDKATVRQRLAIHRENLSCARCHDKIDPLGLAMENYNAAGEWRDREGHGYQGRIENDDPVIDASAKLPDGTEFVGVEGLQEQLLKKQDLFLNSLSNQLHTYALGRELGFSDRPAVKASIGHMKANGRSLSSLIQFIITSPAFTTK
jgi:mono/diheme cytochrome c family protein